VLIRNLRRPLWCHVAHLDMNCRQVPSFRSTWSCRSTNKIGLIKIANMIRSYEPLLVSSVQFARLRELQPRGSLFVSKSVVDLTQALCSKFHCSRFRRVYQTTPHALPADTNTFYARYGILHHLHARCNDTISHANSIGEEELRI
jgi:hypothetical protein